MLTQLICAGSLLIGTVALVLVKQNAHGAGVEFVIGWLIAAMLGLVFGGLVYRGNLGSLILCAAIDAALGAVLMLVDSAIGVLGRILPASDVDTLATLLEVIAVVMFVAGALCLAAIPQAVRYARWLARVEPGAAETTIGIPPPPQSVWRRSIQMAVAPDDSSRRRFWFAIGGLVVGCGAGIAVLMSGSGDSGAATEPRLIVDDAPNADAGVATKATPDARVDVAQTKIDAGAPVAASPVDAGAPSDAGANGMQNPPQPGIVATQSPPKPGGGADSVDALLQTEHVSIAKGDIKGLGAYFAPSAVGFGLDASELALTHDALVAALQHDLGAPPPGGFEIDSKYLTVGTEQNVAWIAEDLEVSAHHHPRRFAITQLAAKIDGRWKIVAWHWAIAIPDGTAMRLVATKRMPKLPAITDARTGAEPIDAEFREAFASPTAYADAIADRADAFNYGSGPGERIAGASSIKRVFARMHAEIKIRDGVRAISGASWDPAQTGVGLAMANVEFATDRVKQTFRVLAVLIKDHANWRIVQAQWSNGGPFR
jgi:hypothetical protein